DAPCQRRAIDAERIDEHATQPRGLVPAEAREEIERPGPGHVAVEAQVAGEEPDIRAARRIGRRNAEEGCATRALAHEPQQDAKRRRLARAVRAEIAEDFARRDGEAHATQRIEAT